MAIIQQIKLKETNWGDEANSLNTNFEQLNLNKAEVGQEITPELGGSEIPSAELKTYTYTNPQGIEETYTFRVGQTAIFQDDRGRSLYAFKGLEGDNAIWERVNDNGDSETTKKLFTAINLALAGEVTGTVKTDLSKNVSINTTVQPMDASKIISGVFDLDRIPKGAIERLVVVPNKTARFALTPEEVQNGDTVKEIDTKLMYYVVDNTKLSTEEGYEVYQAGRAAACPWTGIENKPTTIAGYGITDAYTKDEVQDLVNDFYPMTGGDLYGEITQLLPYNSDGSNPPNLVNFEYRAGASRNAAGCVGIIGDYMVLQAGLGIDTSGPAIWINRNNGSIWIKENGNPDLIKIWNETNDGPNSGLDADTVDGKQAKDLAYFSGKMIANDFYYQTMGYGLASDGWKYNGPAISFGNGDTTGKYVLQLQMNIDNKSVWARSITGSTVSDWKEFAFLDSNGKVAKAVTADTLTTARTLWGQSFDGTGNVSGNMTNVGSITSSGEISTSSLIKEVSSSSERGGFFRIGHPGASWNTGLGAYNVDINTNTSQTPLVLAYRKGTTDYAGANRLFAAELLNDGSILKFAFAGAEKMSFGKAGDIYAAGKVTATKFIGALQGNADSATTATTANAVAWNNVTSKPTWIGATKPTYTAAEVGALASNGTAVAATKLATARTINGVSFDGTSNITITAAANGGNSNTIGGYSNSAILVTRAAPVNVDSTDSTWNSTYNPSSGGTKPTSGYGLVTQFNNIQGGVPGNGGVYVSQLGFDTDGSVRYRNRYDTSAWSTWKQFIFKGDSIPFSNINNITTNNNEFNVVDEGYTDGSNQLLWFNYRRLSGSGKIPIIAFGTADGIGSYATLRCNGVDAQSTIITPGYITTTGNWFQVDKSGCGLYHSTHDIRLMGTSGGWQLESAVHCPGGFWKDSDVRLKSNIKPLNHTLEQILAIPTCSFDMDGKNQIGTIAQEIEKDFPYLISEGIRNKNTVDPNYDWEVVKIPEGDKEVDYVKVKNVAYEQMSILNLEAIKLLNEKIEKLTSRVTELESKLSKYE